MARVEDEDEEDEDELVPNQRYPEQFQQDAFKTTRRLRQRLTLVVTSQTLMTSDDGHWVRLQSGSTALFVLIMIRS
jgi:hypothetical protein